MKEAQDSISAAEARTRELEEQIRSLTEQADSQRLEAAKAQAQLEERARAAYKGEDIAGIYTIIDSVFRDDGPDLDAVIESPLGRMLVQDRQSIKIHKDSERALKETLSRFEQTREEQEKSREEVRPESRSSGGTRAS